ncbi:uncharacterized protein LOC131240138 [Magnolia sinica]|uniref:uncharacterized protein LOC131240138 n=1 Tax=Magnolia sinica TaxID=86752 RepID=UPI0026582847|nr:uncharacterized protein LOC131240138 [Magnolia sinica]
MDIAVKSLFLGLNSQILNHKPTVYFYTRIPYSGRTCSSLQMRNDARGISARANLKPFAQVFAISPGLEDVDVSSSPKSEVSKSISASEDGRIKMRINVSGDKTQVIFDKVFSKLVDAAQPIPGFRRVKGGKTPDIPKDVLLHILGPSKVNKEAIKKIINSTVAECVANEGLEVTKDLKIEESYEELEAAFEPGKEFSFNAIVQLQKTETSKR